MRMYKQREAGRINQFAKTVFDIDKDSPHYSGKEEYYELTSQEV